MTSDWVLAVDFGTTNTAAAVAEVGDRPRMLQLEGAPTMPSSLYLEDTDGPQQTWVTGRSADASALVDPLRYVPTPKRNLGLEAMHVAFGTVSTIDAISEIFARVFQEASRHHARTAPAILVLTHPASWRGERLNRLRGAAVRASNALPQWPEPVLLSEPIAAARHAATARNLPTDCYLAVLDLGGGTCDVAVVQRKGESFTQIGAPLGRDPLGGEDFDARLVADVLSQLENAELTRRLTNPTTPTERVAALDLRRSARAAKETLSSNARAYIRIPTLAGVLPEGATVQISAARLEQLIIGDDDRPGLRTAARLAADALRNVTAPPPIAGVFLVGGSSRIPLLGRLIAEETGHNPLEHGDPATAVVEGAAQYALDLRGPQHPPAAVPVQAPRRRRQWWRNPLITLPIAGAVLAAGAGVVIAQPTNHLAGSPAPAAASVTPAATSVATKSSSVSAAPKQPVTPSQAGATQKSDPMADHDHGTDATPSAPSGTMSVEASPKISFEPVPVTPHVDPLAAVAIPAVEGTPIDVGKTPGFVALTPDARFAYIANRNARVITVVDANSNKVSTKIDMSRYGPPRFISFTPDGSNAYVSVFTDDLTVNKVVVVDTRTIKITHQIPVDKQPFALAVTPNGQYVYVPSHSTGLIDIIDTASQTVVHRVKVATNPHWVTFSPDGRTAYMANHDSDLVSVMNTSDTSIVKTIPVGQSPHSVAVSPDGSQVAVVCFDSNDVYLIDTKKYVITRVPVGKNPQDITYSPDGHFLYTADVESNTVSTINIAERKVTAPIPTDSPTSIAVVPNGTRAFVTNLNAGTLTILRTAY